MNGRGIIGEVWLLSGSKQYIHDNGLFLLNRAITQVVLDLDVFNDEYSKDSKVGYQYYELPDDTLEVVGVCYDNEPLQRKNYLSIKTDYTYNSTPEGYAITFQDGLFQVYLAPPPDEIKAIDFIRKKKPSEATTLDQSIELPAWTERALTLYVKKLVFESARLPQFTNAHQEYLLEVKDRNAQFGEVIRYTGGAPQGIYYRESEP